MLQVLNQIKFILRETLSIIIILLKTHFLQASLQFPLAAHTTASDSASGWHCAL